MRNNPAEIAAKIADKFRTSAAILYAGAEVL